METLKRNHTILVLEDEKPLLHVIMRKLEINNFFVLSARSVKEAINYLKNNEKVDAVWLDHYLVGDKTGLDFVSKVKKEKSLKDIPIFVVSNTATSDKIESYLKLGIEKYYTKSDYGLNKIIGDIKKIIEK